MPTGSQRVDGRVEGTQNSGLENVIRNSVTVIGGNETLNKKK